MFARLCGTEPIPDRSTGATQAHEASLDEAANGTSNMAQNHKSPSTRTYHADSLAFLISDQLVERRHFVHKRSEQASRARGMSLVAFLAFVSVALNMGCITSRSEDLTRPPGRQSSCETRGFSAKYGIRQERDGWGSLVGRVHARDRLLRESGITFQVPKKNTGPYSFYIYSNADGWFVLDQIKPGFYNVQVLTNSGETLTMERLHVRKNRVVGLSICLRGKERGQE